MSPGLFGALFCLLVLGMTQLSLQRNTVPSLRPSLGALPGDCIDPKILPAPSMSRYLSPCFSNLAGLVAVRAGIFKSFDRLRYPLVRCLAKYILRGIDLISSHPLSTTFRPRPVLILLDASAAPGVA